MHNKFEVKVGSNTEFEDLIAYIEYDDQLVGIISQEEGFGNLKMHLSISTKSPISIPSEEMLTMDLVEFEKAIARAKERLWQLRRTEDPQA